MVYGCICFGGWVKQRALRRAISSLHVYLTISSLDIYLFPTTQREPGQSQNLGETTWRLGPTPILSSGAIPGAQLRRSLNPGPCRQASPAPPHQITGASAANGQKKKKKTNGIVARSKAVKFQHPWPYAVILRCTVHSADHFGAARRRRPSSTPGLLGGDPALGVHGRQAHHPACRRASNIQLWLGIDGCTPKKRLAVRRR